MDKSPGEYFDEGKDAARLYAQAEMDQLKLKAARKLTQYSAGAIKIFAYIAVAAVALLFITLSIALAWGKAIGSYGMAFLYMGLIVAGFLIILILISDKIITKPIMKKVIKEFFETPDE